MPAGTRRGLGLLRGAGAGGLSVIAEVTTTWPLARRQLCWAHLQREFTAFTERGGTAHRVGRALLAETKAMFAAWHRVRDGTLSRAQFQTAMRPRRRRVEKLAAAWGGLWAPQDGGHLSGHPRAGPGPRTFVDVPGVEPTNNAAERALRPAVLWRKGCFGTHSPHGSRFRRADAHRGRDAQAAAPERGRRRHARVCRGPAWRLRTVNPAAAHSGHQARSGPEKAYGVCKRCQCLQRERFDVVGRQPRAGLLRAAIQRCQHSLRVHGVHGLGWIGHVRDSPYD